MRSWLLPITAPPLLLFAALVTGATADDSKAKPSVERTARAEIAVQAGPDGIRRYTLVNQRFDVGRLEGKENGKLVPAEIVVQQTLTRHERTDLDSADVRLESTAWMGGDRPLSRQAWRIVDRADEGRFWGGTFYVTRLEPRGPGEYLDRYYDLATGRFLFAASDSLVELDPKVFRRARWVAYRSTYTMAGPAAKESDLGWLAVVSEDGTARSYLISSSERVPHYNPDWGLVDPRDGSVVKRLRPIVGETLAPPLEIQLSFDSKKPQVRLPLGDGEIDLDRARLAPGYRVVRGEPAER
ncbi:MAG TPA: hypothetical protein VGX68_09455 [Thermoanaerobaculia bacterium]|jgi:hypothetical protein|nr:hypothetical protein [Thermoanaerobaculia bacterium]